ncbi:hypothetical protein DFP72DRAFT_1073737 [Ephemerocybe angulata]|uniref:Uncharacterized protein n=1 Tax=Ephemerocybe angulata TaxID=980116 RepID=A0A8H6HMG0_9AGAR|nr:hypothetical protein DFP72DRAFT_1073737 [Tulosesus angulatus]
MVLMTLISGFGDAVQGRKSPSLWRVLLALLILAPSGAHAQTRNVTVSQSDTSKVVYTGEWTKVNDSRSEGGNHRVAAGAGATATFTFTGVAVYFQAPLFPFPIQSNVSLDGKRGTVLDLQDHDSPERKNASATVASGVIERGVWTNLENVKHTVRVTVPIGNTAAVVDAFIVTECTGSVCTPSTSTTSGTTSTTTNTANAASTTSTPDALDDDGIDWSTVTQTVTTLEDLGTVTHTVIVVTPDITSTSRGSSSSSNARSSSSTNSNNRSLAIGFGVAFGVIILALIIGVAVWLWRRNRLMEEAEREQAAGGAGAPPETREVPPAPPAPAAAAAPAIAGGAAAAGVLGGVAAPGVLGRGEVGKKDRPASIGGGTDSGAGGSILGRPGVVGGESVGGSGTATPDPSANMAGIGARRISQRRHSYTGTFSPFSQPEPWDESFGSASKDR